MTTIEWTEKTWNVISGCSKVSPGCAHCYAEKLAKRLWGDRPFSAVQFHPERLDAPIKRRKPTTYFVNSMSDLFHPAVTDEQLDQIFAVMALTPRHTYQALTKRPERMLEYFQRKGFSAATHLSGRECWANEMAHFACENLYGFFSVEYSPSDGLSSNHVYEELIESVSDGYLRNVWLGTSCENQKTADERRSLLLQAPAAVRFLSVEPQLESIRLDWLEEPASPKVDWVICGGESGAGARPFDLAWARSLRDQCQSAGVAFFMKQGGSHPIGDGADGMTGKGNDFEQLPPDLQIRQMPVEVK